MSLHSRNLFLEQLLLSTAFFFCLQAFHSLCFCSESNRAEENRCSRPVLVLRCYTPLSCAATRRFPAPLGELKSQGVIWCEEWNELRCSQQGVQCSKSHAFFTTVEVCPSADPLNWVYFTWKNKTKTTTSSLLTAGLSLGYLFFFLATVSRVTESETERNRYFNFLSCAELNKPTKHLKACALTSFVVWSSTMWNKIKLAKVCVHHTLG